MKLEGKEIKEIFFYSREDSMYGIILHRGKTNFIFAEIDIFGECSSICWCESKNIKYINNKNSEWLKFVRRIFNPKIEIKYDFDFKTKMNFIDYAWENDIVTYLNFDYDDRDSISIIDDVYTDNTIDYYEYDNTFKQIDSHNISIDRIKFIQLNPKLNDLYKKYKLLINSN